MSITRKKSNTGKVTFPLSIFETADTKEDLEDWQSLKKELCIK